MRTTDQIKIEIDMAQMGYRYRIVGENDGSYTAVWAKTNAELIEFISHTFSDPKYAVTVQHLRLVDLVQELWQCEERERERTTRDT